MHMPLLDTAKANFDSRAKKIAATNSIKTFLQNSEILCSKKILKSL